MTAPQEGEDRVHGCFLSRPQRDSARNLGWLKTVKESHGSVERSSLSLARAINSRGTYVIQAPAEGQQVSERPLPGHVHSWPRPHRGHAHVLFTPTSPDHPDPRQG